MNLGVRIRRLEKRFMAADGERWAYSHAQLLRLAGIRSGRGSRPFPTTAEELERLVGPPEVRLQPGEKSAAELIVECARGALPPSPGIFSATSLPVLPE